MQFFLKGLLLGAVCIFFVSTNNAQSVKPVVHGYVGDTLEKKPIYNASVLFIRKSDSTLIGFTRTLRDGMFIHTNLLPGNYLIKITFPNYAPFVKDFEVTNNATVELPFIALTPKFRLLQEVVIKTRQAIKISGDTTSFLADSFYTRKGSSIEDLFKRLPGFEVNEKGAISVQGKSVKTVLIDGEEIFGFDPTVFTQNLPAGIVDKVQVFDSKTEQERLSGFSTQQTKTINITLKSDKKTGTFGRVNIGTNADNYFDSKLMFNRFVDKQKFSLFGTKSNISTATINNSDKQKLGFETSEEFESVSAFYTNVGRFGDFRGTEGLPDLISLGGLYLNKWNDNKIGFNTSGSYDRLAIASQRTSISKIYIDSLRNQSTYSSSNGDGRLSQYSLNGKFDFKIDSFKSVKILLSGSHLEKGEYNSFSSITRNESEELINKNVQTLNNNSTQFRFDNQVSYQQLFRKRGRSLFVTFRYSNISDEYDGFNLSKITFYLRNPVSDTTIDQSARLDGNSKTYGFKISYREPLSSTWAFSSEYSIYKNISTTIRRTFNASIPGKYDLLDSLYSNEFDLNAISQTASFSFQMQKKKLSLTLGSGVSFLDLHLKNIWLTSRNSFSFLKYFPRVLMTYYFDKQSSLQLYYRGATRQPSLDQLQPLLNNNNPLNIYLGNPDLKVGFDHNLSGSFNKYKLVTSTSLLLSGGLTFNRNVVTNFVSYDLATGRSLSMPINVNGNNFWYLYFNWSKKISQRWQHSVQMNSNGGRSIVLTNSIDKNGLQLFQRGVNVYAVFNVGYVLRYEIKDKFSAELRPRTSYNSYKSNLVQLFDNSFYSYGGNVSTYLALPLKFEFNSNVDFDLRNKLVVFERRFSRIIANANLTRRLFKNESGKLTFLVNDIFKQNNGYSQQLGGNYTRESTALVLSRYFLVRFDWLFDKVSKSN